MNERWNELPTQEGDDFGPKPIRVGWGGGAVYYQRRVLKQQVERALPYRCLLPLSDFVSARGITWDTPALCLFFSEGVSLS